MKVTIQSSKAVKPAYGSGGAPATTGDVIPLSIFDNVNFDTYVSVMYAFRPPSPSNAALEAGLGRALADYPLWAGRLGHDADGRRAIVLNHAGVRFVEATADVALDSVMPLKPTPEVLSLHPSGDGVEELFLIQVTRFPCGSLVIGFTSQHIVADGRATNNFYLAWSQATRGVAMDPAPVLDRASFFQPRDPPLVEFDHRGVEFKTKKPHVDGNINDLADDKNHVNSDSNDSANDRNHVSGDAEDENHMNGDSNDGPTDTTNHVRPDIKNNQSDNDEEVVIEKVHFSREFIARLKAEASTGAPRPYSTLQCVVAHLWRCMTKARGHHGQTTTHARIAVDGRARINPHVPDGYTGNVVLWALPTTTARELTTEPLQRVAELINRAVALVDESYFRSFIDFASSGAVEREGLAATADAAEMVLSPNVEVDSWLRIPFYDLDFGGGRPFFFMPTYLPVEGLLILLPSFVGDGSIDAYVPLFRRDMDVFKLCCYSLV